MGTIRNISGWGRCPKIRSLVHESEFVEDVPKIIDMSSSIIARGNGRSYGDAALNETVYSTLKMDKILSFDEEAGTLECQSGILLSDILEFIVPEGFFLPVTPGTKFITLGGAIAADVHGKNHHQEGCFSKHLISFELVNEEGQTLHCSKVKNAKLFWDTVGGMGRTGIITSAQFFLKKVPTAYIKYESIKVPNLESLMNLFEESKDWTYTVAWLDCLQKGNEMGRGIFLRGEHAEESELSPVQLKKSPTIGGKLRFNIPFEFPDFVLNQLTAQFFNTAYYHKQRVEKKKGITPLDGFFYPLDGLDNWNRMYGKHGFTQYQFVLPKDCSKEGLVEVLDVIEKSSSSPFLTVLKLFGKADPRAKWSFPMEGYTLAIDLKITPDIDFIIEELDDVVEKYGGRVYLAKDAFSRREMFNLPEESKSKFSSCQIRRLNPDYVPKEELVENEAIIRQLKPALSTF